MLKPPETLTGLSKFEYHHGHQECLTEKCQKYLFDGFQTWRHLFTSSAMGKSLIISTDSSCLATGGFAVVAWFGKQSRQKVRTLAAVGETTNGENTPDQQP